MQNRDAGLIWREHSFESPTVDEWIEKLGPEIDEVRAGTEIKAIKGTFVEKSRPAYQYEWLFSPNEIGETAIAVPIRQNREVVDIAVFDIEGDPDKWGLVTDKGQFLNQNAVYEAGPRPLRVHGRWWSWFYFGCEGVAPLNHNCLADLYYAGDILAEDSWHATTIFWHAYRWLNRDVLLGKSRIHIGDDSDELIAKEIAKEIREYSERKST